jgi:hypothetical protein
MPGVSKAKLHILKQAFIADVMSPGDAAKKAGVTYSTAKRYYEKWGEEIQKAREQQLIPQPLPSRQWSVLCWLLPKAKRVIIFLL